MANTKLIDINRLEEYDELIKDYVQAKDTVVTNNLTTKINTVNTTLSTSIANEIKQRQDEDKSIGARITAEINTRKQSDDSLNARIDTFTNLPTGSTAGDAELRDIRVKVTGSTAASAGGAVREQILELRDNVIDQSADQPTNPLNKVWIDDSAHEVEVPEMNEFAEVRDTVNRLSKFLSLDSIPIPIYTEWDDGYLNSDGSMTPWTEGYVYKTSKLITIPSGYRLVFNSYASGGTYHYCNYSKEGIFESVGLGSTGLQDRYGIKIDAADTRYVKICTREDIISIDEANVRLEKLPNKKVGVEDLSNVIPSGNVAFGNGYLSTTTHNSVSAGNYRYSNAIFLQKGQTIEIKCSGSPNAVLLMEVNRDHSYIRDLFIGDYAYHRLTYTAGYDMWVRICSRTDVGGNYVPKEEFQNIKFYYKDILYKNEKMKDKKIVVIGDSLIYGNNLKNDVTWCRILELETGATVYNYGVNGNCISNNGGSGIPMSIRYADIPEITTADIIIIEGGANDKNQSAPIGLYTDTDNDTFMGACNVLIDGIRKLNPTANLLFMTTYHRYQGKNKQDKSEKDFADAMIEVCGYKAIPCYNNCLDSGISFLDTNLKSWCDEGIYLGNDSNQHFSPKGYEWIYPKYKNWIESHI